VKNTERSTLCRTPWIFTGKNWRPFSRREATEGGEVKTGMGQSKKKGHTISKLWVLVVLAIGIGTGVLLSAFTAARELAFDFYRFRFIEPVLASRIVLSTTSIALLVALIVVYVKVYRETKANFSLGLLVVLFALLLRSLLSYPLVLLLAGTIPLGPGTFLSSAEIFTVVAYAIFLYLSLE